MYHKILVSGGKTGGHLIPGIAIYEELKKRGVETPYIMSQYDLQFSVTSRVAEKDRIFLDLQNISRRLSWRTPVHLIKIMLAFFRIFGTIFRMKPEAVLITGGYISNPVALSAILLGKPLFIVEQNSVAGITNRFYARFARRIFTSFPDTLKIPKKKSVLTGNPSIYRDKTDRKTALSFFGLADHPKVIAITGGSQGSRNLNESLLKILPELIREEIIIIWSAGSVDYPRMEKSGIIARLQTEYPNIRIYPFIDRMDLLFSACDLAVSRAGATSISEFIQFGLPALLVPIFRSPDNHQYLNALFLQNSHAGLIVEEDKLDLLLPSIREMISRLGEYRLGMESLKNSLLSEPPVQKITDEIFSYSRL